MRGWCVTNASPSGFRSCMEDEGRPFEVGFREQASNHPKRHRSKAVVVSVGGKDTGQVWITETSVSEPLMTCRNIFWRRRNQERSWDKVGGAPGQKPRHGSERNYLWRPTLPSRCLSAMCPIPTNSSRVL